jgi:alpha-tubulin suppressor-like RCC1 family protein
MSDGTVRCWGRNHDGQIGDGMVSDATRPVAVMGLGGVVDIAARSNAGDGSARSCAVLNSGAIQCWGDNLTAAFGDGTMMSQNHPATTTQGLSNASTLGLGGEHSCAIAENLVFCWGWDNLGSLGYTASGMCGSVPCSTTAQLATGLSSMGLHAQQVVASEIHTCALLTDHTVRCFGNNNAGSLGNGTTMGGPTPVAATGLTNATQLATSYVTTCAVTMDGRAYCWGSNARGQLGDGTTMQRAAPVPLMLPPTETVAQLGMGMFHGCAATSSGAVYCWGANDGGQLGSNPGGCDASSCDSSVPIRVPGVDNAQQVVGGMAHTCVLRRDHSVVCWGANDHGQLGDGTNTSRTTPAPVLF